MKIFGAETEELDQHIHFSPMKSQEGVGSEGVQEPGGKPASSPPSPAESPYQGAGSAAQRHPPTSMRPMPTC